ncbi:MAG: aspartate racemase [Herminiimonas sp.]|nr:aspartate racemase [Herminiimonas sp.]
MLSTSIDSSSPSLVSRPPWAPAPKHETQDMAASTSTGKKTERRYDTTVKALGTLSIRPRAFPKLTIPANIPGIRKFVPVGVLGGMGPLATLDLEEKLRQAALAIDPCKTDQDNIGIISFNMPHAINDRTEYLNRIDKNEVPEQEWNDHLLSSNPENPLWGLLSVAKALENAGAHFLIMPCNTAHMYHPVLESQLDVPILHIADAALEALQQAKPGATKVGLLATTGTVNNGLYTDRANINYPEVEWVYPDPKSQKDEVMKGIYDGVKKNDMALGKSSFQSVMWRMIHGENPDAIVLGCTEIPLVVQQKDYPSTIVIDATQALAEMAARYSMKLAAQQLRRNSTTAERTKPEPVRTPSTGGSAKMKADEVPESVL